MDIKPRIKDWWFLKVYSYLCIDFVLFHYRLRFVVSATTDTQVLPPADQTRHSSDEHNSSNHSSNIDVLVPVQTSNDIHIHQKHFANSPVQSPSLHRASSQTVVQAAKSNGDIPTSRMEFPSSSTVTNQRAANSSSSGNHNNNELAVPNGSAGNSSSSGTGSAHHQRNVSNASTVAMIAPSDIVQLPSGFVVAFHRKMVSRTQAFEQLLVLCSCWKCSFLIYMYVK